MYNSSSWDQHNGLKEKKPTPILRHINMKFQNIGQREDSKAPRRENEKHQQISYKRLEIKMAPIISIAILDARRLWNEQSLQNSKRK